MKSNFEKYGIVPFGAVPNERQMEWYRRGKTAFIHFTVNTFTGREWGDGTESPEIFNPTELDCRQWLSILKRAGFSAAILTAKHHDGFCLWPSKYTEHSVKNSPYKNGKGDIVREFTNACREYGIKAGIYLSPWDRNFPEWGTEAYNDYYANQLNELMTEYGDIYECWWDGAGSTEAVYDWKRWVDIIRTNQPHCVIFGSMGATPYVDVRWIGNELGRAGDPCFATIDASSLETEITTELNSGKPDGERFIPAECDVSIRPGWFYHKEQDTLVKDPVQLMDYWFHSAGKNCGILLNIPPDTRGLFNQNDINSLIKWEENLNAAFKNNLLLGSSINASGHLMEHSSENLLLTEENKFYAAETQLPEITFIMPEAVTFNCFRIEEVIELGHRIRGFAIDIYQNGEWQVVSQKECIGFCRSEHFDAVTTDRVRIRITDSKAAPVLRYFGIYLISNEILREDFKKNGEIIDLAALPSARIIQENNTIEIEFGGIFPYNTVIFDAEGLYEFDIFAFNGSQYEFVYYGVNGTNREVCHFETVEGSYKLKIAPKRGTLKDGVVPQVIRR